MELKNATVFFKSLGGTQGRLLRVEVLVLSSTFVWILLELFGSYRRRYSHGFFRLLVWAVYTLFTVLAPYSVGLLQAGPFRDQTFVLWGTILLVIQVSVHSLAVYNIHDSGERKRMLVQHLLQIFLVLWLIVNYKGSNKSYSGTIWMFWIVSVMKVYAMSRFLGKAGSKGGLLEHSKAVADYMIVEHELLADQCVSIDPKTMSGYRYIFHGEEELVSLLPTAPGYRFELEERIMTSNKLSTIDSVWRSIDCDGFYPERSMEILKDITLSFTLFKLLKRRFCGFQTLGEGGLPKTLDFVLHGLLSGNGSNGYVRAFEVIEVELSFLYDFFFTKFHTRFDVLPLMVITAATVWNAISGAFSRHYHRSDLEQRVNETDVIRWITIVLLPVLLIISIMDYAIVPYRWTLVHKLNHESPFLSIIDYALLPCGWTLVRQLCHEPGSEKGVKKCKITSFQKVKGCWERKLGQYSLLLNFDYHPWNVVSHLTLNLVDAKREGQKSGEKIELPEQVIVRVLSRFKDNNGKLEHGQSALAKHHMGSQFLWACNLPTHIHMILVWHIATTMCADKVSKKKLLAGDGDHLVAKSLSDYCAYLVALVPGMLPGHAYDTQRIFDAVVMEARNHLGGCGTLSRRCAKLRCLPGNGDTILELGGRLGTEFRDMVPEEAQRWELLADFWAEFILFLAPSTNTNIHVEMLAAGGEFMTHLWALLTHAGILDRPSSSSETDVDLGVHNHKAATATHDFAV